jgi:hypothetical protein
MSLARTALRMILPALLAAATAPGSGAAERAHPYLYFGARDAATLRARFDRPPLDAKWKRLLANADALLAAPPGKGAVAGNLGRSRNALGATGAAAFAYAMTGERKYADRAKAEVFALLDDAPWIKPAAANRGAQLFTGEACVAAALFYDWCRDTLTPDERARFVERLLDAGIRPYLQSIEKYSDWWVNNTVSNWAGVVHGGCGLAGLALYDEHPDARRAADYAWRHVPAYLREVHRADGGSDEGVMYYTYGATFGYYFATAAARWFGNDAGLGDDAARKLAGYWSVYLQGPDGRFANFNDMDEDCMAGLGGDTPGKTPEGGPSASLSALFEACVPGGDALLLWAADHGGDAFYWKGASPFALLWRRDAPPAGPKPPLDPAALFRESGQAVLQSSSLWLAFSGGWTSNQSHYNQDLGSFVLVANGERLVSDPGYGKMASAEHSTILFGGDGQPTNVRGAFLRFGSGPGFHTLTCDLTKCYDAGLARFVRHVVLVNGLYAVLLDDLAATGPQGVWEWRLQTSGTVEIVAAERRAVIRKKGMLHVVAAAPEDAVVSEEASTLRTLRIAPAAARGAETIVTVLYPATAGGPPPRTAFKSERFRGTLTVEHAAGGRDTLVFLRAGEEWTLSQVNGQSAAKVPGGKDRTLTPYRAREGGRAALPVLGAPGPAGPSAPAPAASPAAGPVAAPKAPAAPPPPADPKALEAWRDRLRERIRKGVQAGEKPQAALSFTGPAWVTAADAQGLTAALGGASSAAIAWSQLKPSDWLALARAFAKEGVATDHATLAFFLMAEGQAKAAEEELARAAGSDSKGGPALVEEVRAAFKAK